jgi:N4-gp56 family major capsid protein
MAVTAFGTNDDLTVKLWSKTLEREVLPATLFGRFMGRGPDVACQVRDDTSKSAGDRIRISLSMLLDGDGVGGNTTLEGNEESLEYYVDNIIIDQKRNAVRHYTRIDDQRVAHDVREDSKVRLRDWWADQLDRAFINQLTGNTVETDTKKTGMQVCIAPDANHIIYGGDATSVATLNAGDEFSLDLIDKAITTIKMFKEDDDQPIIRPLAGGYYACAISPHQFEDMKQDAATATVKWYNIFEAAMQGGKVEENPLFSGSLGVYNKVILFEDSRIPKANNGGAYRDNTRAAVLFGAQSMFAAFGREGGRPDRFLWNEETFDYGNQAGVAASLIFGMKKAVFNSADFSTILLPTWTTHA